MSNTNPINQNYRKMQLIKRRRFNSGTHYCMLYKHHSKYSLLHYTIEQDQTAKLQ